MLRQNKQTLGAVTALMLLLGCSREQQVALHNEDAATSAPGDAGMHTQAPLMDAAMPSRPLPRRQLDSGGIPDEVALHAEPDSECFFGCKERQGLLGQNVASPDHVPPPLSGGTLLATRDGKWLVAADPDRDRVYFVDSARGELSHTRELSAGSEPGRVIEDDFGRIHIALRGRAALLSLTREQDSQMTERAICTQPRGVAYDPARERVHVACADGKLVSLPAAPGGEITRTLDLGDDLRDVLVRGDELLVTRFRASELLRIRADGTLQDRLMPPASYVASAGEVAMHTPTVARRAIDIPGKGSAILHQRSSVGEVKIKTGGAYAGRYGNASVVQSSLTIGLGDAHTVTADLANSALALDMAVSPAGDLLAVVSPGNWRGAFSQLGLYPLSGTNPLNPQARATLLPSNVDPARTAATTDAAPRVLLFARTPLPTPDSQITSVAFVDDSTVALLEREPAAISLLNIRTGRAQQRIELSKESRYDTGHALFHMATSAGLACASCHAEAGDDSHAWRFEGIGVRRTQSLRGGILGSEPFHWDGNLSDFNAVVFDTMVGRMALGGVLSNAEVDAFARWIDKQPRFARSARDAEQVARGKALFEAEAVGCSSCHSGALLTNNQTVDVGTGEALQVPALRGVSFQLPVMHDGCARTLAQRFEPGCGGAKHGQTAQLSAAELADLVAYLESL